jgi:hypothetical protein
MTDDLEDFAQWRGSVDEQLGSLGTKVETEAHLRATMDGDMGKLHAEFRAQRSMLQALHDTQQDHTAQLADLATGQKELRTKLDLVHVGVEAIHGLLTGLTANGTNEDHGVTANPVDGGPDALP